MHAISSCGRFRPGFEMIASLPPERACKMFSCAPSQRGSAVFRHRYIALGGRTTLGSHAHDHRPIHGQRNNATWCKRFRPESNRYRDRRKLLRNRSETYRAGSIIILKSLGINNHESVLSFLSSCGTPCRFRMKSSFRRRLSKRAKGTSLMRTLSPGWTAHPSLTRIAEPGNAPRRCVR